MSRPLEAVLSKGEISFGSGVRNNVVVETELCLTYRCPNVLVEDDGWNDATGKVFAVAQSRSESAVIRK